MNKDNGSVALLVIPLVAILLLSLTVVIKVSAITVDGYRWQKAHRSELFDLTNALLLSTATTDLSSSSKCITKSVAPYSRRACLLSSPRSTESLSGVTFSSSNQLYDYQNLFEKSVQCPETADLVEVEATQGSVVSARTCTLSENGIGSLKVLGNLRGLLPVILEPTQGSELCVMAASGQFKLPAISVKGCNLLVVSGGDMLIGTINFEPPQAPPMPSLTLHSATGTIEVTSIEGAGALRVESAKSPTLPEVIPGELSTITLPLLEPQIISLGLVNQPVDHSE